MVGLCHQTAAYTYVSVSSTIYLATHPPAPLSLCLFSVPIHPLICLPANTYPPLFLYLPTIHSFTHQSAHPYTRLFIFPVLIHPSTHLSMPSSLFSCSPIYQTTHPPTTDPPVPTPTHVKTHPPSHLPRYPPTGYLFSPNHPFRHLFIQQYTNPATHPLIYPSISS